MSMLPTFKTVQIILKKCINRNPDWQALFLTQYNLSSLLAIKCEAGINIRQAYHNQNREILEDYCNTFLPEMKKLAEEFMEAYRTQWMDENKIFGLDVFDLRMGGLLQRIQSAIYRLNDYLKGSINKLEELEQEILYFDGRKKMTKQVLSVLTYGIQLQRLLL